MARGPSNRSFGDVMREIGRALGFSDRASVAERDRAIASNRERFGSQAPNVSLRPRERPTVSMIGGGDRDRDRDGPATPVVPVAPPAVPETPVAPPVEPVTPEVPQAPTKVNPSDMTSTGASEDLALESANQGLASTILTSGQGIVEEEPGLLRDRRRLGLLAPRRSLTGGGLIQ
jgi:hypothetical protein